MDEEKCVIRSATDADLPGLAELYRAFLGETVVDVPDVRANPKLDADRAATRLMRARDSCVLVAETGGALIGFAWVQFRKGNEPADGPWGRLADRLTRRQMSIPLILPPRGWLGHVFVTPEHRRQGIASTLVRTAADWTRDRGGKALELNVLSTNEAARKFYKRLGMSEHIVRYRMDV